MVNFQKSAILILLIIILSNISFAIFEIDSYPISNQITTSEKAYYNITIKNNDPVERVYTYNILDIENFKSIFTKDQSDYLSGIRLKPNETYTSILIVEPKSTLKGGWYTLLIVLREKDSGTYAEIKLPLYISQQIDAKYTPDIASFFEIPNYIDPRAPFNVTVHLRNIVNMDIDNVEISFKSNIIEEQKNIIKLNGLEQKEFNFEVKLNDKQSPITDILVGQISIDGKLVPKQPKEKAFEIRDYTSRFDVKREITREWFLTTENITYINNGNSKYVQRTEVQTTFLKRFFQTLNPKHTIETKNDNYVFVKDIELNSNEKANVIITTNYRSLVVLFILLLIGFLVYQLYKSPVIIKKSAHIIEKENSSISKVKVTLNIKNRGKEAIKGVEIVDKLPHIGEIMLESKEGFVKPTSVDKGISGTTLIRWNIDFIDPGEERVITYLIKSKLLVIGDFNLPNASVRFAGNKGKKKVIKSNSVLAQ